MKNIDVYLEPLIEELEELWRGIKAHDMNRPPLSREFFLKVVLMWMMHNFPGYGECSSKH